MISFVKFRICEGTCIGGAKWYLYEDFGSQVFTIKPMFLSLHVPGPFGKPASFFEQQIGSMPGTGLRVWGLGLKAAHPHMIQDKQGC